ncbi:glycosyltransferase [Lichenicola sp.]|uniref:glycosyltransferase n=1 Tax=Lichenicola sp. TaxID=2804529 RepID=UPI003B00EBAB
MPLQGSIDDKARSGIRGWVRDPSYPELAVGITITADDMLLERLIANRYRPDLQQAGFGRGRHGFEVEFNPPLPPHRDWLVHVRGELDGLDMPGSPFRIPAATHWDTDAQAGVAALLSAHATDGELEARIDFLTLQRTRLAELRAAARPARLTALDARQPQALVIDECLPDPRRDGGSSALVSHMQSLQRLGFAVRLAAPSMRREPAAASLEAYGITVCCMPGVASVEEVLRRDPGEYALVYLHRIASAAAYAGLVRQTQPQARLIYSVADLHHLRLARQALAENRPDLEPEARRLELMELQAARAADAVITHSGVEAEMLRRYLPTERVHVVAWSVPVRDSGIGFAERSGVAFIGCFNHAPNQAAARVLRDRIMPLVLAADPTIECRLVGSGLPAALCETRPGLLAEGHVEDLGAVLDRVRLTVAPLSFGAGLKSKVLESLAAGVPCVCSPVAAEGLELPGELGRLVVPDIPAAAASIVRLHGDREEHELLSEQSRAYAAQAFSAERLDRLMAGIVR